MHPSTDINLYTSTYIHEVEVLSKGRKHIHDKYNHTLNVDHMVFACLAIVVVNIYKRCGCLASAIPSAFVYVNDHDPDSGHIHTVLHSDGTTIEDQHWEECLKRTTNYVGITEWTDNSVTIENQYNFGVQTPGPGTYNLPLDKKPVMLISYTFGIKKAINKGLVV